MYSIYKCSCVTHVTRKVFSCSVVIACNCEHLEKRHTHTHTYYSGPTFLGRRGKSHGRGWSHILHSDLNWCWWAWLLHQLGLIGERYPLLHLGRRMCRFLFWWLLGGGHGYLLRLHPTGVGKDIHTSTKSWLRFGFEFRFRGCGLWRRRFGFIMCNVGCSLATDRGRLRGCSFDQVKGRFRVNNEAGDGNVVIWGVFRQPWNQGATGSRG